MVFQSAGLLIDEFLQPALNAAAGISNALIAIPDDLTDS